MSARKKVRSKLSELHLLKIENAQLKLEKSHQALIAAQQTKQYAQENVNGVLTSVANDLGVDVEEVVFDVPNKIVRPLTDEERKAKESNA